ncbi:MAG: response regulator transcription factor [Deltaproteobacteria bacterium]|nr:response regulator transcription factor [Deltaproteobacteria bacterium]
MTYKAVIADDEKELRTYLKAMLAESWPELVICGEAANGREALEMIDASRPQIAFLDIRMPGFSGLDVAKKIADKCRIVFVTAYDDYAVEAFEREAVDYLVKPVSKKRLTQTIERLKKQLQTSLEPAAGIADVINRALANLQNTAGTPYLRWIRAQHKESVRLIPVEEVDYFQAEDKYTLVMTAAGESLIKKSIKELAGELDPQQFWQIHRATIVNVFRIENVSRSLTGRGVITIKDRPESLVVSRSYLHLFKQM